MLQAPKEIQDNFQNSLKYSGFAFNWALAACRYFIGNSTVHTTNMGGRQIYIETRQQTDDTVLWVVKMESWVLGKDGQYHWEPLPSDRTNEFISNTRFASAEKALSELIKYENTGIKKPLFVLQKESSKKMEITQLHTEEIGVFHTFDWWVNKASTWLVGFARNEKIICLDKNGNACNTGTEFQYARDNDLFPVTAYRLIKSGEQTLKEKYND